MYKLTLALLVVGLNTAWVSAQDAPMSEAVKAIKDGLVSEQGDATALVRVDEVAVQKVESLAAKGNDIKDAVDYLESRINFDPLKKVRNEKALQPVRDRLDKALKRRADVLAGKVAPVE